MQIEYYSMLQLQLSSELSASNYETGKTNPDSYALVRLAEFFGVSIDYLVGYSDFNIKTSKQLCELVASMEQQLAELKRHLQ